MTGADDIPDQTGPEEIQPEDGEPTQYAAPEAPAPDARAPDPASAWPPVDFVGGALCLDFCNTVGDRQKRRQDNRLGSFTDWVAWHRSQRLLSETDADRLQRTALRDPTQAAHALREAVAVREQLYGIFSALAAGGPPPDSGLAAINELLPRAVSHPVLVIGRSGFSLDFPETTADPRRLLWPVVRSAAELLTGPNLGLLRECGRCSWLFLDRTRNASRRWCRMQTCGNRAKVQRHYRRRRPGQEKRSNPRQR